MAVTHKGNRCRVRTKEIGGIEKTVDPQGEIKIIPTQLAQNQGVAQAGQTQFGKRVQKEGGYRHERVQTQEEHQVFR